MIKRFWDKISYLGLENQEKTIENRTIIISNQANLMLLIIMVILTAINAVYRIVENTAVTYGSVRLNIIIGICLLHIVLSHFRWHNLFKVSLIFSPVTVFILISTFIHFVEQESYFYYPYAYMAFSLIPQLVLIPQKNKILYLFSLLFFFLMCAMLSSYI